MTDRFNPLTFYPEYSPYTGGQNDLEEWERIWAKNYYKKDYQAFTYPAQEVTERGGKLLYEPIPELLETAKDVVNPQPHF